MAVVRVKDGVQFAVIAPGGFRMLWAVDQTAQRLGIDLTITSGTDGEHSGPGDPHHRGEAYDIREHFFMPAMREEIVTSIKALLGEDRFFAFIESPGTENEHIHVQVKKGTVFP